MDVFERQRILLDPLRLAGHGVDLVGAGSLGGAILLCLCKMGFGLHAPITVSDMDTCDWHNLPTQWFRAGHVELGQNKAEAVAEMAALTCDREITAVNARFTGSEERRVGPIVVLAVDSLAERRRIWEALRRRRDVRLLVDARMGGQLAELHCVDLAVDDPLAYERSLGTEGEEEPDDPCTRGAIFYTVLGAAAFVGRIVRAHVLGESHPRYFLFDFGNFFQDSVGSFRA